VAPMISGLLRVAWSEQSRDGTRHITYTKPWDFQDMPRIGDRIDEESLEGYSACTVAGVYGSGEGLIVELDPIIAAELTEAQRNGWRRRLRVGGWTVETQSWTRYA
jgi:hypothetical protein